MSGKADPRFASVLQLLVIDYGTCIFDVDTLAASVCGAAGDALAAWLQSSAVKARLEALQTADEETQSTLTDMDFVEVEVTETMIDEALTMGDERSAEELAAREAAEERAGAAELLARQLEQRAAAAELRAADAELIARQLESLLERAGQRAANEQTLRHEAAEQHTADTAAARLAVEQRAAAAE